MTVRCNSIILVVIVWKGVGVGGGKFSGDSVLLPVWRGNAIIDAYVMITHATLSPYGMYLSAYNCIYHNNKPVCSLACLIVCSVFASSK